MDSHTSPHESNDNKSQDQIILMRKRQLRESNLPDLML